MISFILVPIFDSEPAYLHSLDENGTQEAGFMKASQCRRLCTTWAKTRKFYWKASLGFITQCMRVWMLAASGCYSTIQNYGRRPLANFYWIALRSLGSVLIDGSETGQAGFRPLIEAAPGASQTLPANGEVCSACSIIIMDSYALCSGMEQALPSPVCPFTKCIK